MKQLDSSSSGIITKSEVTKAIKDTANEKNIVLSSAQVSAAVEQLFNEGELNSSGNISRTELREALMEDGLKVKTLLEKEPVH
jgi:Ca2+-binding EF-hand superfamily protein